MESTVRIKATMASLKKKKKKKRKREEMERPDTMDYQEALKDPAWDNERRWADDIMKSNRRLGLVLFKLDQLTKGKGSCFPIAVVQQLNREEVYERNSREDLRHLARAKDQHMLRVKVKDFICRLNRNHQKVRELREFFYIDQAAKAEAGEQTETLEEYWEKMLKDTTWADGYFIRATAWFLQMEIQIMDTKCTEEEPYYTIDGDFTGECCTDILYIGYVSEVHYQSLLLNYSMESGYAYEDIEMDDSEKEDIDETSSKNISMEEDDSVDRMETDDVIEEDEEEERLVHNKKVLHTHESFSKQKEEICQSCKKTFKNMIMHIKRNKKCKISDAELRKLEERSKQIKRERKKSWLMKSRGKLQSDDPDKLKKMENERKCKSREKLKTKDYKGETAKDAKWQAISRQKRKEADPEAYKERTKKENASKKLRQDKSEVDRLRRFQESVMYGPMFLCVSCHGKMFRCSVKILTNRLVEQIDQKIPIEACLDFDVVTKVVTESRHVSWPTIFKKNQLEVGERFICETCVRYLKEGKLPPKSF